MKGNRGLKSDLFEATLLVREPNGFDSDPVSLKFSTKKYQSPLIRINDFVFSGAKEGEIGLGDIIYLDVLVQNIGQGIGEGININFSLPLNVSAISATSSVIKALKANESQRVRFEFIANKLYSNDKIPIKVKLTEKQGLYGDLAEAVVQLNQRLAKAKDFNLEKNTNDGVDIQLTQLKSDVDINIPITNTKREDCFVLIFGNEDYASFQSGLSSESNVDFAINDAKTFAMYCEKTLGINKKNIFLNLNSTSVKMKKEISKIKELIKLKNGKAEVIFYFAGHGLPRETTKEAFLIPVDVTASTINDGIKLSELYKDLTTYSSKQILVLLDACFSGGARGQGLMAARGVKIKPKNDFLAGNVVVLSASSGEQTSLPYMEKQHGIFTYFLLKRLQETKGKITIDELANFIIQNVSIESVRTNSKKQTPQVLVSPQVKEVYQKWRL